MWQLKKRPCLISLAGLLALRSWRFYHSEIWYTYSTADVAKLISAYRSICSVPYGDRNNLPNPIPLGKLSLEIIKKFPFPHLPAENSSHGKFPLWNISRPENSHHRNFAFRFNFPLKMFPRKTCRWEVEITSVEMLELKADLFRGGIFHEKGNFHAEEIFQEDIF